MSDEANKEKTPEVVSKADYDHQVEINRNLQGKLTTLEKDMKKFEGFDLEAFKQTKAELESLKQEKAKSGGKDDIDKYIKQRETELTTQFNSKYEKDISERDNKIKELDSKLYELKVVDGVLSKVGGLFVPESHKFLKEMIRKEIKLEDDGFSVINDKGERVYKDGKTPLSIEDWAALKREENPFMALDKSSGGSGKPGQERSTPGSFTLPANAPSSEARQHFAELHKKKIEAAKSA